MFKSSEDGFTLIELLVVVTIITLVMGFAVPRLGSFLDEDRSKKGILILSSVIKDLRRGASKNKSDTFLVIDPAANQFWIESGEEGEKRQRKSLGQDIDIKGVKRASDSFSGVKESYIRFYKKGYNDPFIIVLQNRNNNKAFTIVGHPFLTKLDVYEKPFFSYDGLK